MNRIRWHIAHRVVRALSKSKLSEILEESTVRNMNRRMAWRIRPNNLIYHMWIDGNFHFQVKTENMGELFKYGWKEVFLRDDYLLKLLNENAPVGVEEVQFFTNFINIKLNWKQYYEHILQSVWNERDRYGSDNLHKTYISDKRIVVEYSSPNIAKSFHAGHLRSTFHGDFIANLLEANGSLVTRINYLGDWGTHIGLLLYGLMYHGNEKLFDEKGLSYLLKIYVSMNKKIEQEQDERGTTDKTQSPTYQKGLEMFHKLEKGDKECRRLWEKFRALTMEKYPEMYKRLNVKFTSYEFESDYVEDCKKLLTRLERDGRLHTDASGRKYVMARIPQPDVSKQPVRIEQVNLLKADGTTLYITRDIAAALARYEKYKPDMMIYVVENGQTAHFENLFAILKMLNVPTVVSMIHENLTEFFHMKFGLVRGLSTRKGTDMLLEDILDDARQRMLEKFQIAKTSRPLEDSKRTAEILGVTGLKIMELKRKRSSDYKFLWQDVEGLSKGQGLHLQYCHARLCSLLENCKDINLHKNVKFELLDSDLEANLIQMIALYELKVENALIKLFASSLALYTTELCIQINRAYKGLRVEGEPKDVAEARLFMFFCAKVTLANSMKLLGIEPLEKL